MKKSKYIDHTLLKPESTKAQVQKIVDEAKAYDFATVMVNPCWIPFVKPQLEGTDVKAACVIGFPLGANTTAVKVFETKDAIANGASKNKSPKTDSFEKLNCELTDSGLKAGKIIAVTTNDITSGKLATKPPTINWAKSFAL